MILQFRDRGIALAPALTPLHRGFGRIAISTGFGLSPWAATALPALAHNTWSAGTPIPVPVQAAMAGVLNTDVGGVTTKKIYVVGGVTTAGALVSNTQIYDPTTNTWSSGAALPTATAAGAVAVIHDILYIFGGYNQATLQGSDATDAVWAYNPKKNKWSSKAIMPTARGSDAAAVFQNIAYVIGGNGASYRLNTVKAYNPITNAWAEETPLLQGKSEPSVATVGSLIIAAGGFNVGDSGDTESYNPLANVWTGLRAEPIPTNESCTGAAIGKIFVLGGTNGTSQLATSQAFAVAKQKWVGLAPMPNAAGYPAGATDEGIIYCFGGGPGASNSGTAYDFVQIYTP